MSLFILPSVSLAGLFPLIGFSPHYWLCFPVLILFRLKLCWVEPEQFSLGLILYNDWDKTLWVLCLMPCECEVFLRLMLSLWAPWCCFLALATLLTCVSWSTQLKKPVNREFADPWRSPQCSSVLLGICPEDSSLPGLCITPALPAQLSSAHWDHLSCLASPRCGVAWTFSAGSKLGQVDGSLHLFALSQGPLSWAASSSKFNIHCFLYFLLFFSLFFSFMGKGKSGLFFHLSQKWKLWWRFIYC